MTIYSGYYGGMKKYNYPHPICIASYPLKMFNIPQAKWLAPHPALLFNWKRTLEQGKPDMEYYIQDFTKHALNRTPQEIYDDLIELCEGQDCTLICYEKAPEAETFKVTDLNPYKEFCHRHIVTEYLRSGGFEAKEFRI